MRGAEQGLGGAGIEAKRTCVCLGLALALQLSEAGADADAGQGEGLNGDERRRLPVLQLTRVPTPAHAQLRVHRVAAAAAEAPLCSPTPRTSGQDATQVRHAGSGGDSGAKCGRRARPGPRRRDWHWHGSRWPGFECGVWSLRTRFADRLCPPRRPLQAT